MKTTLCLFLGLLTAPLLAACGGGGGGSSTPAPTLTAVTPVQGPAAGGTAVGLTGTGFISGTTTVTFGGVPATAVVVASPTSLSCLAPAGPAGTSVDVSVTTSGGTGTIAMGYAFNPLPTTTAISRTRASTLGGRSATITGTGYLANAAGANAVTIGGAAAGNVVTVDDTTITCTLPAGAAGSLDVSVTNANGAGTLAGGITYVTPVLYAATARSSNISQPGTLYTIDTTTGAGTLVGVTGDVLTGLAFDPTFTTLYGLNTSPFADQSLFTVDPATGATTLVGPTGDGPTNNCGDLTFAGASLIGNSWNSEYCSFDTATGAGTVVANNGGSTSGLAIAADENGVVYVGIGSFPPRLHTQDPVTGALTLVATITGAGTNGSIAGLTFFDGVLYGIGGGSNGSGSSAELIVIDPATAVATSIGFMPNSIDAIEGNIR